MLRFKRLASPSVFLTSGCFEFFKLRFFDAADVHRAEQVDVSRSGQVIIGAIMPATFTNIFVGFVMTVFPVDATAFWTSLRGVMCINFNDGTSGFASFVAKKLLKLIKRPRTQLPSTRFSSLFEVLIKRNAGQVFDDKECIRAISLNESLRNCREINCILSKSQILFYRSFVPG